MHQKGPCPSTLSEKICPDNLYWPVRRNSGIIPCHLVVIVEGSNLKF